MSDESPLPLPGEEIPYGPATTPYTGAVSARRTSMLSLISLILGILGVVAFWVVFFPVLGPILMLVITAGAIVLGFTGKAREPLAPRGLWLTGIILGFLGLGIAIFALSSWIVISATAGA